MPALKRIEKKPYPQRTMQISLILALVILLIYAYLDLASYLPAGQLITFPQPWNDNIIYIIILVASIVAAGMGFLLTRRFEAEDPSRLIWLFFSIGWGFWALGEFSGYLYNQIYQTLPDLTITDLFWTFGYIFFSLSLYQQYQRIYRRRKQIAMLYFLLSVAIVLLVILGITAWVRQAGYGQGNSWLSDYLFIFYPACDLVEGLAALWLSFLFGRGLWGRPWWGLFAFAVSDGISTWYWMGGYQFLTPSADTWLSLFTDILYIGGYLMVTLACLSILLLLRYGIVPPRGKTPEGLESQ